MARRLDTELLLDLALGGHTFTPLTPLGPYIGPPLWRCQRCTGVIPQWAVTSAPWRAALLAATCTALLPALPRKALMSNVHPIHRAAAPPLDLDLLDRVNAALDELARMSDRLIELADAIEASGTHELEELGGAVDRVAGDLRALIYGTEATS